MIIIKGARVHGEGEPAVRDLYIEDGRFIAKPEGTDLPESTVIQAEGLNCFPGFIDSLNVWGIQGPGWKDDDQHEGSAPLNADLDVFDAFDHDGMNFQRVYRYGVTAAGIAPLPGNVLAGQAAVFKTHGRSAAKMLVRQRAAMVGSVSRRVKEAYASRKIRPMTRMGIFFLLEDALRKASRYVPGKDSWDAQSEALRPVLEGKEALFINAITRGEIESLFSLLAPYPQIRLILTGAYSLTEADLSAREHLAVIFGDMTERFNPSADITDIARIVSLMETGAPIAIGCAGDNITSGKESLLWNTLFWRRHGLSAEKCLRGITRLPAELLGVDNRLGQIAPGYDADFSLWTGNPLDRFDARLTHCFINGEDVTNAVDTHSVW